MNTSNPNINPGTDLMAVVPEVPSAPAINPAVDVTSQATGDQNLRTPTQQLDALKKLRESITAQNKSASELQPEQCLIPTPDSSIEKGQVDAANSQPIQPAPISIQPAPISIQPIQPVQPVQPATEQPVPPAVRSAAPAAVPPTDEPAPSATVQPTAALDSFAEQQKDLQQLQLLRLKAARRQREAHELSQEYTKEQLAQMDPAQLAQLAQKKAADKIRAAAQKAAAEKTAHANAAQVNANQSPPPVVDGAPNQQLGQQPPTQPYVPQELGPVDQHAAMMQSAIASNVHPQHPGQQGHPQAVQYQQSPYPYPQMPQGTYPPMGYPPQVAPQHPLAGAPNPNAPPMQPRSLTPKVESGDVEEFFESQYAAKHLEERDHSFMKQNVQFRNCLMHNLREGIIYIDAATRVTSWNRSAEELTGITSTSVKGFELTPSRLGLVGADGNRVDDNNCPMKRAMETDDTLEQKFVIRGRSGRESKIEMTIVPVKDEGQILGAVIIINDHSIQVELERQVKDLHLLSVRDPLTQVANRAEFERLLEEYVRMHRATKTHCCIIVCDIDFFKQVNDTYGHHIGDQALISFACMLQKYVRARDVVARYGGEEFVILCANCNIDSAVGRAEEIRMALNKTPQQMLNGKTMSASFGVSQLLDDESITDFFVRADQALYKAKESGRNQVVRASTDAQDGEAENAEFGSAREMSKVSGLTWRTLKSNVLFCEEFVSRTPQAMLVQKMRGFIDEKQAQILRCDADCVSMVVRVSDASRSQDFRMDIELQSSPDPAAPETHMRVVVFPPQRRLFRGTNDDLYHRLVLDIRQYLMINDEGSHMHLNTFADPTKAR